MNLRKLLDERIGRGMSKVSGAPALAVVTRSSRPEFGDFQANGAMALAKKLKRSPREIAAQVIDSIDLNGIADKIEIAGPGFINIWLSEAFLSSSICANNPLIEKTPQAQTVVVDYSSPNLAKEMHVGHLRSTVIGDCVTRVLSQLGHTVIRQNHVGDWGTQFGMLLTHMDELKDRKSAQKEELADLEFFYRAAKKRFDSDPEFADRARANVVALQSGNVDVLHTWQQFIDISLSHCEALYERLDIQLTRADVRGESAYNDDLKSVVEDLDSKGLLSESNGARCVFLDEFKNKDGEPLPVIVQKSDGGYLYATTDLSAVRHRFNKLRADRALYIVGAPQILHFQQIFAVARLAGYVTQNQELTHHSFGSMLAKDGKPFSTRKGGAEKLANLLDEAEERAFELVSSKSPEMNTAAKKSIARVVGFGAVKYADLSKNRTNDYIFDWDQMLSFDGNTAPYLQYAYSRIKSLFKRGEVDFSKIDSGISAQSAQEHQLAVCLLVFQETVESVGREALPHLLCNYLYELASNYMRFYEHCPVLSAEEDLRNSRLLLCKRTADTLKLGLSLLGIGTVERM